MNYSQLATADQQAIVNLMTMLSPQMSMFAKMLDKAAATDAQYLSLASAALAQLVSSEFSGANLASSNATSAQPVVTSATHNATADEVGNLLNITAGTNWTPGLYPIIAVSANAYTLNRPCGTAASLTLGTWAVLTMVPNGVSLNGAAPFISRADIVSMVAHIESVLASFNDGAHKNLWVKACGAANLT